jgi:hypothetical protein
VLGEALNSAAACQVVGHTVLPAAPDDVDPGAGRHAHGVRMVVASSAGAAVDVGPGHSTRESRSCRSTAQQNPMLRLLPDCRVDGATPVSEASASGAGKRLRASPISANNRAARKA